MHFKEWKRNTFELFNIQMPCDFFFFGFSNPQAHPVLGYNKRLLKFISPIILSVVLSLKIYLYTQSYNPFR